MYHLMLHFVRDLRYAHRSLKKSPGFTFVAVLTLALGVGANTAVFSLINSVLLRPLPYPDPSRLVLVWESAPFFGMHDSPVSPANYVDWRARARSFEEMGAIEVHAFSLTGEGEPELLQGSLVSPSALRALRTHPSMGRVFRDEEDVPGAPKVAMISEKFWRRRFASDPNIVGKAVMLSDAKHTIVGIIPAGSEPPSEYGAPMGEVWAPFGSAYTAKQFNERGRHNWMVIGRLRPGVSLAQADAEMSAIGKALAREYPDTNEEVGAFVAPFREHFVTDSRRILFILLGTVTFVLLIACSNLVNLLLSRAANRNKEVAVRSALGAGALQLARQFLSESLLLSAAGTAAGVLLATTTFDFLARLAPADMIGMNVLQIDWRVMVFTFAIAAGTTVAFGLVPLWQVRRVDVIESLKQSGRNLASSAGSRRIRSLLICSEVALAFVLLISAGLLIQTLSRLRDLDTGFRTKNVLTMGVPPPQNLEGFPKTVAYQNRLIAAVRAVPGVESAGYINDLPMRVKGDISGIGAEGHDGKTRFQCNARAVGPGYFETMGMALHRGRGIQETDVEGAPFVVVINETLARMLWPGSDAIGRQIYFEAKIHVPVIGVVADVRQSGLDRPPQPEFYISALQAGSAARWLAIRTRSDPSQMTPAIRRAIWSVNPDQPVTDVATMEQVLDQEVASRQLHTGLLVAFAGLALLLAAVGLYGVLAYLVAQQTPEIGIRMALGANPAGILRKIVGQGLRLTGAGIAIGVVGALAASRYLSSILFEVKPTDPATYFAVGLILLAVAALASYLPARRAMRIDPNVALRDE